MTSDVEWHITESGPEPYVQINGVWQKILWAPLEGSQRCYLSLDDCPLVLYESGRGVGKTLTALCGVLADIDQGKDSKSLFIRKTHPELSEAIALGRKWLPQLVPGTSYNRMGSIFEFPSGATLWMSYAADLADAETRFMGHSYTHVVVDESCSYPDLAVVKFFLSCLRTANKSLKLKMRLLTNPYGIGRSAHMRAFRLPLKPGITLGPLIVDDDPTAEDYLPPRRVVHGFLGENLFLKDSDYAKNIAGSTDDPARKAAWLFGSWAEPSESLWGDIFAAHRSSIEVPWFLCPNPLEIRLSVDHGTAAPAAICFWWENTHGTDIPLPNGEMRTGGVRRDLYLLDVLYLATKDGRRGMNLTIAEIANRIRARCIQRGFPLDILKRDGNILDSACFASDGRPSIAEHYAEAGINFEPCWKAPGSRSISASLLREWLTHAAPTVSDEPRSKPGLFVCADNCGPFLETVPFVQRSEKDASVWAENQIDHVLDAVCYKLTAEKPQAVMTGRVDAGGFHPIVR